MDSDKLPNALLPGNGIISNQTFIPPRWVYRELDNIQNFYLKPKKNFNSVTYEIYWKDTNDLVPQSIVNVISDDFFQQVKVFDDRVIPTKEDKEEFAKDINGFIKSYEKKKKNQKEADKLQNHVEDEEATKLIKKLESKPSNKRKLCPTLDTNDSQNGGPKSFIGYTNCGICFEEISSSKLLIMFGVCRHWSCNVCIKQLKECPWCKTILKREQYINPV